MNRIASLFLLAAVPVARADDAFEKHVRPVLVEQCLRCHDDKKARGGLSLTSRQAALKGGDSGPAIVPGDPAKSPLIQALHYVDPPRMPPAGKLADRDIAALTAWVKAGAPWPDAKTTTGPAAGPFRITAEQRAFWAFQPLRRLMPPAVTGFAHNPIDRFLLARLEAAKLPAAKRATRHALIRRATVDLTGLPPTPEEVDAFVADERPDAWQRLIDRLLASPAYGERWGRHWLDLVRYTDSFDARGVGGEMDCADAWRYRDWVVNAFNADMPYNRFVAHQIAGDLLGGPDGIIATGLLALGNWGGGDADKEKLLTDIVDDQIDVVGRTFLGLTLACARCHDHKFDPISAADYYGLAGIFFSTHILPNVGPKTNGPPMMRIPLQTPEEMRRRADHEALLSRLTGEVTAARRRLSVEAARQGRADTVRHLLAAYDRSHGKAAEKVSAGPQSRWAALLASSGQKPLTRYNADAVPGRRGLASWRDKDDCPNALVNSTAEAQSLLTFRVPPRSVALHPGPKTAVGAALTLAKAGPLRITGKVRDADPTCGDGIAWSLRRNGEALASGDLANGGAIDLPAAKLQAIAAAIGDRLELVILPKAGHECDTTAVELVVHFPDGTRRDLGADVSDDPALKASHGWSFFEEGKADLPGLAAVRARLKGERESFRAAAEAFARGFTRDDESSPFWPSPAEGANLGGPELRKLEAELARARTKSFPPPRFANGAQEGGVPGSPHAGVHDVKIHVRGRYDKLGELVPRRFPEVLSGGKRPKLGRESGRRELAEWLTTDQSALTARVMVNRMWQHHFGRGLVNTPSNFGALGERPSHPELLDWLASELIASGWSLKHVHRLMMQSEAYQRSADGEAATVAADPDNLLVGRMSRRRLESEALRDALASAAGELNRGMGGPAIRDFATPRRSLYVMTIRSDRAGFGPLFDVADSTAPTEKRTVSTTAPQALFLMNNGYVKAKAAAVARRLAGRADRVDFAYRLLYSRPATRGERELGEAFLREGGPLEEYAMALLGANELVYVD